MLSIVDFFIRGSYCQLDHLFSAGGEAVFRNVFFIIPIRPFT